MPFWLYILRCADGSYYTGHTDDMARRLAQHDAGSFEGYTNLRRPVQLVYSQEMASREEALAAEMQIKRWSRRKKEALIRGDVGELRAAARKTFANADFDPPF
jgi:predicted GIY-YIG superfamily endonuclease